MKIRLTHWCHNCYVAFEHWNIPQIKQKATLRHGMVWPTSATQIAEIKNKCPHCNHEMKGSILYMQKDEDSPLLLQGVKEIS